MTLRNSWMRSTRVLTLIALLTVGPSDARAVMAGDASADPPDSPERRVDPNTQSSPWAGVGSIVVGESAFGGVLIAPNIVLTAAHVAGGGPDNVAFVLNAGRKESHRVRAAEVFVHPEFVGGGAAPNQLMEHDIALVRLATPVESGVPIYPLLNAPLNVGQRIVFVGYGSSGFGNEGPSIGGNPHLKRVGSNRIDQFIFARNDAYRRIGFLFDFDGPNADSNVIGAHSPQHRSIGNRDESTFASGDSGSPSFVRDQRGRWLIAGVNTFVGAAQGRAMSTFGSVGGGMLVSAYLPWIESIVAKIRAAKN